MLLEHISPESFNLMYLSIKKKKKHRAASFLNRSSVLCLDRVDRMSACLMQTCIILSLSFENLSHSVTVNFRVSVKNILTHMSGTCNRCWKQFKIRCKFHFFSVKVDIVRLVAHSCAAVCMQAFCRCVWEKNKLFLFYLFTSVAFCSRGEEC